MWQTPPDLLPRDVLLDDLKIIEELEIEVRLNEEVGRSGGNGHRTFLARLCDEFDAVYLAIGPHSSDIPDLQLDERGFIQIDPVTFQTSMDKVFAGGDVLRVSVNYPNSELDHSAILSLSEGRRAATSIDRYLQKVSLTAHVPEKALTKANSIPTLLRSRRKHRSLKQISPHVTVSKSQRPRQRVAFNASAWNV